MLKVVIGRVSPNPRKIFILMNLRYNYYLVVYFQTYYIDIILSILFDETYMYLETIQMGPSLRTFRSEVMGGKSRKALSGYAFQMAQDVEKQA